MPVPLQEILAEKKSGSGGFPVRNFSPLSFSAVTPPENFPAVNLYLVSSFKGDPIADVVEDGYFVEKLVRNVFFICFGEATGSLAGSMLMNGSSISASSLSNPGMFAISKAETMLPEVWTLSERAFIWKSVRKKRRESSVSSEELRLTGFSERSYS